MILKGKFWRLAFLQSFSAKNFKNKRLTRSLNMFKKLLVASAILAVSSSVFASGVPYIGTSLGINDSLFKTTQDTGFSNATSHVGGRGAVLDVFGGYGITVNQKTYVGGEIFVNDASNSVNSSVPGDTAKLKTKYSYGVSLIPGVMVSENTLAYVRAGVVKTRFDYKETDGDGNTISSDKSNQTGAQVGLGLKTKLTQNVDLRGEYDYTAYRSYKIDGVKFNPSSDAFKVGIVYNFG
jgi:opacity protein-like surface antigen